MRNQRQQILRISEPDTQWNNRGSSSVECHSFTRTILCIERINSTLSIPKLLSFSKRHWGKKRKNETQDIYVGSQSHQITTIYNLWKEGDPERTERHVDVLGKLMDNTRQHSQRGWNDVCMCADLQGNTMKKAWRCCFAWQHLEENIDGYI